MKRATFTILFFIKRSKLLKTGEAPVYLRITSNGDSSEISIKRSIKPSLWDTVLVLISYIQPFEDGNKRTAHIISNAILKNEGYCPISFRTVDSIQYKKAMLVFYEQNNINPFKRIFIDQYEFAVQTYF